METYFSLNGVIGLRKDFVIPQNQWVDVQMTQKKIVDEYVFEYRVGNKTETLINREPADFKDVLAWVSSPFTETLTTSYFGSIKIRNFEVCTPGRNCKSISILHSRYLSFLSLFRRIINTVRRSHYNLAKA